MTTSHLHPPVRARLLDELRSEIHALTSGGGSLSASIYDTSQVLRFAPPADPQPAIEWLLSQQASDGAWGQELSEARARTTPTVAAILALHQPDNRYQAQQEAAIAWLTANGDAWAPPLTDDLPVGVELLLPALLTDAKALGIPLPFEAYEAVQALGVRRRKLLNMLPLEVLRNGPGAHSAEGWDAAKNTDLFNDPIGLGCSPAATAAFLQAVGDDPSQQSRIAAAKDYLNRAALSTQAKIPGVTPTAFPIDLFELAYSLHTLAQADLLNLPFLADVVRPHLALLQESLSSEGIGCTIHFTPDGDDTAAAIGALFEAGIDVDMSPLARFQKERHYSSYHGELQPSAITTARVAQVLAAMSNEDSAAARQWLRERQQPDGTWLSDKWNQSWMYTTLQAILALRIDPSSYDSLIATREIILSNQRADGGWGVNESTCELSAYGLLSLASLPEELHNEELIAAYQRGHQWLLEEYDPTAEIEERHWLAKENYSPFRVSRITILSALLHRGPESHYQSF